MRNNRYSLPVKGNWGTTFNIVSYLRLVLHSDCFCHLMCSYCTRSCSRAQQDSHLRASVFCGLFAVRSEPTITTQGRTFIENYFLSKWALAVVRQYFFIRHYLKYSRPRFMSQTCLSGWHLQYTHTK